MMLVLMFARRAAWMEGMEGNGELLLSVRKAWGVPLCRVA